MDVDFANREVTRQVSFTGASGSAWDTAVWDSDAWAEENDALVRKWFAVNGLGRNVALRVEGGFQDVRFSINAINYILESGGLL